MEINQPLIIRAQQGDPQALNQLFTRWYRHVYHIAYRYFGDVDTAADICQQTFLTVQQKLGELRDPLSFKVWLYRMVINLCHMEARRSKSRRQSHEAFGSAARNGTVTDPSALLQQQENTEILLAALRHIPEEQRVVIIMKELEDLKFREIAEVLEISENTVKSRLYYGLKALRTFFLTNNLKIEVYHD